jgi:hypothetical protein
MSTQALTSVLLAAVVATSFVACGDGDDDGGDLCRAGAVQCLSDKSGVVCASDGNERLPFACDDGQLCGTDESGRVGCLGGCEPGETECASQAISRVCSDDGKAWIPVACEPGTGCDGSVETDGGEPNPDYGTCVRSDDPTVTVCKPRQTTCADASTVKACEIDGSNWVYTPCAGNEVCVGGECAVDPEAGCTPNSGVCVDATHVKKCAEDGKSYAPVETCPATSTCSEGACRGPVCTVGEIRCDDVRDGNVWNALAQGTYQERAVYACVDGERWEVTECAAADVCAYTDIASSAVNQFVEDLKSAFLSDQDLPVFQVPESSRARCQTPACAAPFALRELLGGGTYEGLFFGSYACGDAAGGDPSDIGSFSLCEGLPPYDNLHWANYACPENTECAYVENVSRARGTAQSPVCQSACTENDVRCYGAEGEATITCHDGAWDPTTITACAHDNRERWCRRNVVPNGTTNFTQASCQDPACVVWQDEFGTFLVPPGYGACGDDGKFYQCLADGTIDRGVDCPSCVRSSIRAPGVEEPSSDPRHFAGYRPGYCLDECANGEEQCLAIGSDAASPFYFQCESGHWTTVASCPDGRTCNDFPPDPSNADAPRRIVCGAISCFPGETRCVDEEGVAPGDELAVCDATGEWARPTTCERGVCSEDDQLGPGKAACEDQCIPGTKACSGTEAEVVCDDDARFGTPAPCEIGTACVPDRPSLARLGCLACVPADPREVNSTADTRCVGASLEVCGPDGRWAAGSATTCPNGCVGTQGGNTTPGSARAYCAMSGGAGGQAGSGSGAGAGGLSGGGGLGGAGGAAGTPSAGAAGTSGG